MINPMLSRYDDYDGCWFDGEYEDQNCYDCPYKEECSGYEGDDDDDESDC